MSIYRKDKDGKLHRIASSYIEKKGDPALTIADFYEIDTELNVDDTFETHINAFNRKPVVGDMYSQIAKGYDEIAGRSWIINLIITSVSDNIATSRIKDIVETTGAQGPQGEQGPKGDTGNEALTTFVDLSTSVEPYVGFNVYTTRSTFNREPVISSDVYMLMIKGSNDIAGRSWIACCRVIGKEASTNIYTASIQYIIETTGTQGPQGERGIQGEQGIQGPKGDGVEYHQCVKTVEDGVEYYDISGEPTSNVFFLQFSESNTTYDPKIRCGSTVYAMIDDAMFTSNIGYGKLEGVFYARLSGSAIRLNGFNKTDLEYGVILKKSDLPQIDNELDHLSASGYNIYLNADAEDNGGVGELIPFTHEVYSGDEKGAYFVGKNYTHRVWYDSRVNEWKYESYPKERAVEAPGIYMLDYSEKIESGSFADSINLTSDMFLPTIDINQFDTIYAITNIGQFVKCNVQFDNDDRTNVWNILHVRNMGLTADTISVNTIKTNDATEITFSSATAFGKNVHINAGNKLYTETISAEPMSRGGAGTVTVTSSTNFNSNVAMAKTLRAKSDIRVGVNEQIKLKHDGTIGYITIYDTTGNTMFEVNSDVRDYSTSISMYKPFYGNDNTIISSSKSLYLDSNNNSINGLAKIQLNQDMYTTLITPKSFKIMENYTGVASDTAFEINVDSGETSYGKYRDVFVNLFNVHDGILEDRLQIKAADGINEIAGLNELSHFTGALTIDGSIIFNDDDSSTGRTNYLAFVNSSAGQVRLQSHSAFIGGRERAGLWVDGYIYADSDIKGNTDF